MLHYHASQTNKLELVFFMTDTTLRGAFRMENFSYSAQDMPESGAKLSRV